MLITGACGLVGRELTRQLAASGCRIRGVDCAPAPTSAAARFDFIAGELTDELTCRRACAGMRTIVHTAALQYHSGVPRWGREWFFQRNVTLTQRLVDAAAAERVKHLVMISSDMVYGLPRSAPVAESTKPLPIGPYGRSKLECEWICQAARDAGLRVTILRPRLIIGPGRLGVLRLLFDRIRTGRRVPLIGDGANRYQMVAVADVADACCRAIERRCDGVFNLGSDDPPTVAALLGGLCKRAGSRSRLVRLPAHASHVALWMLEMVRLAPLAPEQFRLAAIDYVLDTTRARESLGWTPRYSDLDMIWSAYRSYTQPESATPIVEARTAPVGGLVTRGESVEPRPSPALSTAPEPRSSRR